MGGGSSNKPTSNMNTPNAGKNRALANLPGTLSVSAYMPGQRNALADQLAAGGFGTPAQNATALDETNRPMSIPVTGLGAGSGGQSPVDAVVDPNVPLDTDGNPIDRTRYQYVPDGKGGWIRYSDMLNYGSGR
ncbi:MAG: hypothetical protein GY943_30610 [Chloroflexi bacterium]|nr:hypothetical protein [Chloroflexota bacterium]